MMSSNLDFLFTLGEAQLDKWLDYQKLGVTQEDVPTLLQLVLDEALHNADTQSKEVWVPLHAWRALGQLRSEAAIEPLISLFDVLVEDDWALEELPKVMGMIGPVAIEPLNRVLLDETRDEFVRVMAIDGLKEIAQRHSLTREDILSCYRIYMLSPSNEMIALNGLLIACLLDLHATELMDEIRDFFDRSVVDESCAGDLQDVEIEFGFRRERNGPRKNSFAQQVLVPDDEDLDVEDDDNPLVLLQSYLLQYGGDAAIDDVTELDGFFVALACCPHMVQASEWLPALWGGEEHMPCWESEKEMKDVLGLIMWFYNVTMEMMNEGEHLNLYHEDNDAFGSTYAVEDWCNGFLRGFDLWGVLSPEDEEIVDDLLSLVSMFADSRASNISETYTSHQIAEQMDEIEPAVLEVFDSFLKRRAKLTQPIVRETPKCGRNDPCPCGSGKKFKKCCLH